MTFRVCRACAKLPWEIAKVDWERKAMAPWPHVCAHCKAFHEETLLLSGHYEDFATVVRQTQPPVECFGRGSLDGEQHGGRVAGEP